jgi:hypothetical protein
MYRAAAPKAPGPAVQVMLVFEAAVTAQELLSNRTDKSPTMLLKPGQEWRRL